MKCTDEMIEAYNAVQTKLMNNDRPYKEVVRAAIEAAIAASPQAAQPVADNSDWENTYGPDYEVDDVGSVPKVDTLLSVRDGYCRCGRLVAGHALSTHADAGEVDELKEDYRELSAENDRLLDENHTLRAQLVKLRKRSWAVMQEALDGARVHPCDEHSEDVKARTLAEPFQKLYATLSTTAKP